jgi:hypothetical protein
VNKEFNMYQKICAVLVVLVAVASCKGASSESETQAAGDGKNWKRSPQTEQKPDVSGEKRASQGTWQTNGQQPSRVLEPKKRTKCQNAVKQSVPAGQSAAVNGQVDPSCTPLTAEEYADWGSCSYTITWAGRQPSEAVLAAFPEGTLHCNQMLRTYCPEGATFKAKEYCPNAKQGSWPAPQGVTTTTVIQN